MKLRKYEKVLRMLLDAEKENRDITTEINSDPAARAAVEYWESVGCVLVDRAGGGEIGNLRVTPKGTAYFVEKERSLVDFWREHIVSFFGGFLSGALVTGLAWFLTERL